MCSETEGASSTNVEAALAAEFEMLESGAPRPKKTANKVVPRIILHGDSDFELALLRQGHFFRIIDRAIQICA